MRLAPKRELRKAFSVPTLPLMRPRLPGCTFLICKMGTVTLTAGVVERTEWGHRYDYFQ